MAKLTTGENLNDLLYATRMDKRQARKGGELSLAEKREAEAKQIRKVDAMSSPERRDYTHINPNLVHRAPDHSRDNRQDVIKRAANTFKQRVSQALGKGGIAIDFDGIKVEATSKDLADDSLQVIDKAIVTFAVNVDTPTKPMKFFGCVDYNEDNDRHDKYAVRNFVVTADKKKIKFSDEGLRKYASMGNLDQHAYSKIERKLVAYDMSNESSERHAYRQLEVKDVDRARAILEDNSFRVHSKFLGPEAGSLGHVYEVEMLPMHYDAVKKVLAGEWKEYSRDTKNDEGKAWSDATESTGDWSGRSREKNPAPHQKTKGKEPHNAPHSDEDKAFSQESEEQGKWPGRAHDKEDSMLPPKKDVNRNTKNDEFDGNHMTDDRTEKATEFPGRTMEKGVAKEANPKDMLRWEQKKAQMAPPSGGLDTLPGEPGDPGMGGPPMEGAPGDVMAAPEDGQPIEVLVSDPMNPGQYIKLTSAQLLEKSLRWASASKKRVAALKVYASDDDDLDDDDDDDDDDKSDDKPDFGGSDDSDSDDSDDDSDDDDDSSPAPKPKSDSGSDSGDAGPDLDPGGDDMGMMSVEVGMDPMMDDPMMSDPMDSMMGGGKDDAVCDMLEAASLLVDDPETKAKIEELCADLKAPDMMDPMVGDGADAMGMGCGMDEGAGMLKETGDNKMGMGADFGMGSYASKCEFYGRTASKWLESLARKGYKVKTACYCKKGSGEEHYCRKVGCSNNPACNMSRGVVLAQAAGKADMLKAKSHPSPEVKDESRTMDGMHKRDHDGGEKVRPGEVFRSTSDVKKSANHEIPHMEGVDPAQRKTTIDPSMVEESQMVSPEALMQSLVDPNMQGGTNPALQQGMDPSIQDFKHYDQGFGKQGITTSGTDNDPPTHIDQAKRPMDGMTQRSGDESAEVVPSEEASDCKAPGININPSEDIVGHDYDPVDGMTRNKKMTMPTNSGATKDENTGTRKASIADALREEISGPEVTRKHFTRVYAKKKNDVREEFEQKRLAHIHQYNQGFIDFRETDKRIKAEKKDMERKLAEMKQVASDLGRETGKGGKETSQFEKGREKYHEDDTLKNRSEFEDKEWNKRSDEKAGWKGNDSHNYHKEIRGDEGKQDSDETEDDSKWPGRSREKNPSRDKQGETQYTSKGIKPREDEEKAMSDETEDPKKWPGRSREKAKSVSKDAGSFMYKDSEFKMPPKKDKKKDDEVDESGDSKEAGAGEFINASRHASWGRQAVEGAGDNTSYKGEGKDDISTKMPSLQSDSDVKGEGHSDERGEHPLKVSQPDERSVEMDKHFTSEGEYLKKGQMRSVCPECGSQWDPGKTYCSQCMYDDSVGQSEGEYLKKSKKVEAIDQDHASGSYRRHRIDQQVGRVKHLGHEFKGNDVNFSANQMAVKDISDGRVPNAGTGYSVDYMVDRVLRGMSTRDYNNANDAFKQIVSLDDHKWMSEFQKRDLAQRMAGYGLRVDEDVVEKCLTEGNVFNQQQRGEKDSLITAKKK